MKNYRFYNELKMCITLGAIIFLLNACDTTETNGGSVSLSFASGSSLQKINNDLVLTEVKILIRDIKLEKESDGESEGDEGNNETETEEIKIGPIVVNLNPGGMTTDFVVDNIPAGIYDELKFEIHKLEASETPPDPEFRDGDDSSQRYSVIVKGQFNNNLTQFTYKSRKSAHQELEFENLLTVEDGTSTNLTITVDPYSWFYKDGLFLDPTDTANEDDIDNNIEHSFKRAFEDDDYDGEDD